MQKIKLFLESDRGKDIFVVIIVLLLGISSFYLGRLSKENTAKGLKIEYNTEKSDNLGSYELNNGLNNPKIAPKEVFNPSIAEKAEQAPGKYFASKIGQKYYPIGCSAGKNIKLENRIYFQTSSEAENAGFELSSSCR